MMRRTVGVLAVVLVALCAQGSGAADDETQALLRKLRDQQSAVRSQAAMELAFKDAVPREAVGPLAAGLADRNLNVRYWAATALKRLGPGAKDAVPALRQALKTFPGGVPELEGPRRYFADVRAVAAQALGAIGVAAREALPDLQEASRDQDRSVREAALEAVEAIAPEDSK